MIRKEHIQQRLAQRFNPPYVRYWERKFRTMHLWQNWLELKQDVVRYFPIVQEHLQCSHRTAKERTWLTYIDSTEGTPQAPFFEAHQQLVRQIHPIELPIFLCHLCIGADIQRGYSLTQAKQNYQKWLLDDPTNQVFGDWVLTSELQVIPLQTWLNSKS